MNNEDKPVHKNCLRCDELITVESKFCKHCGVVQIVQDDISAEQRWFTLKQVMLFYGFEVLCCVSSHIDAFKTFAGFLLIDILLAINKVSFFAYSWRETKVVLKWPDFSFQKLCAYCGIALTCSLLVHYSVNWLNTAIWSDNYFYYSLMDGGRFHALIIILFTAVFPALFEELGFRGYLLQKLLKVADAQQAIFISAFLFAVLHMSFLSLFWLIPFALFLGYVRIKEKTIWYGVFFHFCFNLGACLFELM